MATHIEINEHLTKAPHDEALLKTFLGQAHIAGTGPDGKTCRECVFFHKWQKEKIGGQIVDRAVPPGYYSIKYKQDPLGLKKARCNRPILNKANRLIPHSAGACRLFEQSENPPAEKALE